MLILIHTHTFNQKLKLKYVDESDFDFNSFVAFIISIVVGLMGGVIIIYFNASITTILWTILIVAGISFIASIGLNRRDNALYNITISVLITILFLIIYLIYSLYK
jgi:uncharacterized membrane protein YccC